MRRALPLGVFVVLGVVACSGDMPPGTPTSTAGRAGADSNGGATPIYAIGGSSSIYGSTGGSSSIYGATGG